MSILLPLLAALVPIFLLALVVAGVRRLVLPEDRIDTGTLIRQLIVYAFTFGLMVLLAIGVSRLLGLLLPEGPVLGGSAAGDVAAAVSFTVVAAPALLWMWRYVSRKVDTDPTERSSPAWGLFLAVAELVFLLVAFLGLGTGLAWLVGLEAVGSRALTRGAVWTVGWVWIHTQTRTRPPHPALRALTVAGGSLLGLAATAVGVTTLVARLTDAAYNELFGVIITGPGDGLGVFSARQLIWVVLGGAVWWWYWFRSEEPAGAPITVYRVLAGTIGGVVTVLGSLGIALYETLVWFFGESSSPSAVSHFSFLTDVVPTVLVGGIVWRLHPAEDVAGEANRAYRYLVAGLGLVAAASGLGVVVNAFLSAFVTPLAGEGTINLFLGGVAALSVGGPVWVVSWSSLATDQPRTLTRRIYLTLLAGVGGLTALITLTVIVFRVTEGLIEGSTLSAVLDELRAPVGVLISTVLVAAYHLRLWRRERDTTPPPARRVSIVLVASDPEPVATALKAEFDVDLVTFRRADGAPTDPAAVVEAVRRAESDALLVLAEPDAVRVVPLRR